MIEIFIDFMKEINISQIVVIYAGMFVFYNRLDKKIDKLEGKFEKLEGKFEKLNEKVEDIDRSLCCIEGSLSTHGHCLFNQSKNDKKII